MRAQLFLNSTVRIQGYIKLKRTIFYSWQSDLPNNTNWTFIEDSIVLSTKELKKIKPIPININIDRATREDTGIHKTI